MTETTAMMRRKNTSRRVQALSSGSIRSDEIAATDMALSRDWSRDGVSDMGNAVHGRDEASMPGLMAPRRGKINPADVICGRLRRVKGGGRDCMKADRRG